MVQPKKFNDDDILRVLAKGGQSVHGLSLRLGWRENLLYRHLNRLLEAGKVEAYESPNYNGYTHMVWTLARDK